MKKQDVIDYFGSARDAAEALGLSASAVHQWGEDVPRNRQTHVEAVTKGKLKRSNWADNGIERITRGQDNGQ